MLPVNVPISYLSEYGIGTLYNSKTNKIKQLGQTIFRKQVQDKLLMCKKPFPLIGNEYFIRDSEKIIDSTFSYLSLRQYMHNAHYITYLISPYTILQYLLNNNDILIKEAFTGEILSAFEMDNMKYIQESGRLKGEMRFDASKIKAAHAVILSRFLFLKNNAGVKLLKSIYSNVNNHFHRETPNNGKIYPDIYFSLENYRIVITGKLLYNFNELNNKQEYVLAYKIKNIDFLNEQPYTVDEIRLFPYNERTSTSDRENHNPETVLRPTQPNSIGISLDLSKDSANNNRLNDQIKDNDETPFLIPVKIITRKDQLSAYNVIPIGNDLTIEAVCRDLENINSFENNSIENIKSIILNVGNFEYFKFVMNSLRELCELKQIELKIKEFSKLEIDSQYQFVSIEYSNKTLYLIEFGSGIIGGFNGDHFHHISNERLTFLSSRFNEIDEESKSQDVFYGLLLKTITQRNLKVKELKYR